MKYLLITLLALLTPFLVYSTETEEELLYFPKDKTGLKGFPEFMHHWYSKAFEAVNEPSLLETADTFPYQFRFTILGAWSKKADRALRINENNGQYWLYTPRAPEVPPMQIDANEIEQLKLLIEKASFYALQSQEPNHGLDGSEWIVESVINGEYHVVSRWSPSSGRRNEPNQRFLAICEWFFEKQDKLYKKKTN